MGAEQPVTLMINLSNPLQISITLYIVSLIVLYMTKPSLCFDENSKMKIFGCGNSYNTLFPFYGISIIISIIGYLFFF